MATARSCDRCGTAYIAKNSRSRFCTDICRAKTNQERKRAAVSQASPVPAAELSGLMLTVRAQLESVERINTTAGQAALALARRIDLSTDSGAGMARMIEVLMHTLDRALEGVKTEQDIVDQLQERRDGKRHSAAAG